MDVEKYYKNAFLELPNNEKEKEEQIEKFNKILDKVEKIMDANTDSNDIFEITSDIKSPLREDNVKESIDRETIFINTDHREYGYFKLDNIMED